MRAFFHFSVRWNEVQKNATPRPTRQVAQSSTESRARRNRSSPPARTDESMLFFFSFSFLLITSFFDWSEFSVAIFLVV